MLPFRTICGLPLVVACLGASCETAHQDSSQQFAAPALIAHRGGTADRPENTMVAIRAALGQRVKLIWLSVQLSAEGEPVLYRPAELSALSRLNAGWNFAEASADGEKRFPYRNHPVGIPALRDALREIPDSVSVVLNMKAMPAEAQTTAVARVLESANAWGRVLIYSTEADYQRTFAAWPKARLFESRDATRNRLVAATLGQQCQTPPVSGAWAGFELRRKVDVVETFTLGEGRSPVNAVFWTRASVDCYRSRAPVSLVAFGVNDRAAYCDAKRLGLDFVMVDSPEKMAGIRAEVEQNPALCGN